MKRMYNWLTVCLSIVFIASSDLNAQGLFNFKGSQVNADSSEFQQKTNTFILKNNVRISTGKGLITCDYAEVNTKTFDFDNLDIILRYINYRI